MVNRYIFKHGLSEGKILEIALDRVFEKAALRAVGTASRYYIE
jgi:hypothetical protein